MRRIILLLVLTLLLGTVRTNAKEVTADKAAEVAVMVLKQRVPGFSGQVGSVDAVSASGSKCYYIVNFTPRGWALIAADDAVNPILGYSSTGTFRKASQPDNLRGWLGNYADEIQRVIQRKDATRHKGWELPSIATRAAVGEIAPLIKVNWNQGSPYNKYCPKDAGGQSVVGCVAVAMAQAVSAMKYPSRPTGEFSYTSPKYGSLYINYDQEPTYNWNDIISGANGKDDVARLLYQCGVAVRMDYGVDGSGTQCSYIATALQRNFSYPTSVKFYSRSSYSGNWKQLIVNELQSGRPVCYSGQDIKKGYGHCFNLDGYDGNNMFHVNWGWGGANNGFFTIDGLKDATMDMDYTAMQGVVVGIRPPSNGPGNIVLSSTQVKEKQPIGTVVGKITVESEATNPSYTFSVRGPYSIILHKYTEAPFEIVNGELRTTKELNASDGDRRIEITVKNTSNNQELTQAFTISVVSSSASDVSLSSSVGMSYNKLTKEVTLSAKANVTYTVYSGVDNNVVASGELSTDGNSSVTLSTTEWEAENVIEFNRASETKRIKVKLAK